MKAEYQQKLRELKRDYVANLPVLLAKISEATQNYLVGIRSAPVLREFYRAVHSLTGSGATYGYEQLSADARALENELRPCLEESPQYPQAERIMMLYLAVEDSVCRVVRQENAFPAAEVSERDELINRTTCANAMKILVAEDDRYSRERIATMLEMDGHTVLHAENGQQVIEMVESEKPDLVLMDAIMPLMSGFEAAWILKQNYTRKFLPIIFLTALEKVEELVSCIESGGDDFLVKPVNHAILNARILAMQRITELNRKLESYQAEMEEEIRLTKHVFDFVTNRNPEDFPGLDVWLQSCSHFSGDMFSCAISPQGDRYAMLGDFTGHGMRAAVGIIPVSDIFYAMASKGLPLTVLIGEINEKLHQLLPTGQFLCAFFVRIDAQSGAVEACNAGLPSACLLYRHGTQMESIPSTCLPLGVLSGASYQDSIRHLSADEIQAVVAYSDGLTELRNQEGEMLGEDRIKEILLEESAVAPVARIRKLAHDYMQEQPIEDDISVFSIHP